VSVVVIGLNHRTASLDLLERMTVPDASVPKALGNLCGRRHLSEAVVLSTCNRTEVYAVAERFHGGYHDVRDFFCELAGLPPEDVSDHLYVHYDEAAVAHLFAVAAGLDSAVVGESEILGQVGDAWDRARDAGAAGATLNLVFRHALEVGKRVRTETGISRGITSVSHAAVAMAVARLGGTLEGRRAVVLGAGEMGERMAGALATVGGTVDVVVASRTLASAAALADRIGGRAAVLRELPDHLVDADVLLTSTAASTVVLDHADLERVMARRHGRALLVVDIAVPRDVDPGAADIDGVTLLDMDDLRAFVETEMTGRRREAVRAREIVDDELERYQGVATAREVAPLVAAVRSRAEALRQAEIERLAARLRDLDPQARAAVDAVTKAVVAKLLHDPTVRLKDAAGSARGDRLAEALRDLFDL
jgi:glutamyl-tRNA reductase